MKVGPHLRSSKLAASDGNRGNRGTCFSLLQKRRKDGGPGTRSTARATRHCQTPQESESTPPNSGPLQFGVVVAHHRYHSLYTISTVYELPNPENSPCEATSSL